MKKSASKIISDLERRVAKLEKSATQSGSVSIRHKEPAYESPQGVLNKYTDNFDKVTANYGFGPHWDERYEFDGLSQREEKRLLKELKKLPQVDEVSMFVRDDSEQGYRDIKASKKSAYNPNDMFEVEKVSGVVRIYLGGKHSKKNTVQDMMDEFYFRLSDAFLVENYLPQDEDLLDVVESIARQSKVIEILTRVRKGDLAVQVNPHNIRKFLQALTRQLNKTEDQLERWGVEYILTWSYECDKCVQEATDKMLKKFAPNTRVDPKTYRLAGHITASSKKQLAAINTGEYSTAEKFKSHIKDRNTFVGVLVCGLKKLGNRNSHKILGVLGGGDPFNDKVIVAKCKLLLKGVKDIPSFIRILAQINIGRRFLKNEQFEFLVRTYLGNFLKFYDVTIPQDCIELMYPGTSMVINDFNTWVEDVDLVEEDITEENREDMDDSFSYEYGSISGVHGGKFTRITNKITRELEFNLITNQDSRELDLPKEYARVAYDTLEDYFEKNQDTILDQFFLSKDMWEYGDEQLVDASLGLLSLNDDQIELTVSIETESEEDIDPDPEEYDDY